MAGTKNFREDFTSKSRVIETSKIIILVQLNPPFPCLYCHQVIGQLVRLVYISQLFWFGNQSTAIILLATFASTLILLQRATEALFLGDIFLWCVYNSFVERNQPSLQKMWITPSRYSFPITHNVAAATASPRTKVSGSHYCRSSCHVFLSPESHSLVTMNRHF